MDSSKLLSMCRSSLQEVEQYKALKDLIEKESVITKGDLTKKGRNAGSANYGRKTLYKKGIYFAYKDINIVYIGMIGDKKSTSLYDRFKGHGKGSHKFDYDEVKFHRFQNLSDKEFLALEAMLIMVISPKYNKAV